LGHEREKSARGAKKSPGDVERRATLKRSRAHYERRTTEKLEDRERRREMLEGQGER